MKNPFKRKGVIETPNYVKIRDSFKEELLQSSRGKKTSLPFIHNVLPSSSLVRPDDNFQVFVVGGTNGETATVHYDQDGAIKVLTHQAHPELAKFATLEDFLSFIDSNIDDKTSAIGLNFAFTLLPIVGDKGQIDGVMVSGDTKGHAFSGLQQKKVGEEIEKHFQKTHHRALIASVGNDTVCLIASATERNSDRNSMVAGIVGTGYNLAFFLDHKTIINVQASDFTGFTPTSTGKIIDKESSNVGEQLYNKEVAAGELYKHYNALVRKNILKANVINSTKELADLAITNQYEEGDIARALFHRSASLVAAHFAGFYEFKGCPNKITAIMQGGLFWDGPNYKETVDQVMIHLGVPNGAVEFRNVKYSDIIGAAKLITGGT
jgi:hexokinase